MPDSASEYGRAFSCGYIVSEEEFWKAAPFGEALNFLKFTGSYGEVGNSQGVDDFASLQTYTSGLYGAVPTLYFSGAGNQALTWETSKKTDVGFTFGALQDRLRGDFSYYHNLVDGLILRVPQAPSRGIPAGVPGDVPNVNINSILGNVGSMRNTGIEFNLTYNAIQKKNFSWTVSGNITTLKNRVLTLATEGQRIGTATSGLETVNFTEVGRYVGEILVVKSLGVNPANGQRMVRIKNADGTFTTVQYNHQGTPAGTTGWTA